MNLICCCHCALVCCLLGWTCFLARRSPSWWTCASYWGYVSPNYGVGRYIRDEWTTGAGKNGWQYMRKTPSSWSRGTSSLKLGLPDSWLAPWLRQVELGKSDVPLIVVVAMNFVLRIMAAIVGYVCFHGGSPAFCSEWWLEKFLEEPGIHGCMFVGAPEQV